MPRPAFLVGCLAVGLASTTHAQGIAVSVDGTPVPLPGKGVVRATGGSFLVPLRGILESLGATVRFESSTRTITAVRGETTVVLRLGDAIGHVNQTPTPLQVPAQSIDGATMVPLRFVAEALGASVKWDAPARTIRIATAKPVAPAAGGGTISVAPPVVPGPVAGTVASVDAAGGVVSIRTAAPEPERIALAPEGVVLVAPVGGDAVRRDLSALRPGDQILVKARDAQGRALVVEAAYAETTGAVAGVDATPDGVRVVLEGGATIDLPKTLPASRRDPVSKLVAPSSVTEIRKGDTVVVRTSPVDSRPTELAIAAAPPPVPAAPPAPVAVEVAKVTHSSTSRWLRAGETLTIFVEGTPKAGGMARVPGLPGADALSLVESAPGKYTATVAVAPGIVARDLVPVAVLTVDKVQSRPVAAAEPFSVDTAVPAFGTWAPVDGAETTDVRPNVTGTYTDAGSGVDARRVRFRVDGKEVSTQATVADSFLAWRPATDLAPGRHTVEVELVDVAGNLASRSFSFLVKERLPIRTFTVKPDDRPIDFGDILTFVVEGAPDARTATVSIGEKTTVTLREGSPGTYVGTYTVRREDHFTGAVVLAKVVLPDGREMTVPCDKRLVFTAGAPDAPTIELPQEGAVVGNSVVLSGRARPNATIRIAVRWQGRKRGVVGASGAFPETVVVADAKGRWATEPIPLRLPREVQGPVFVADVVAVGTGGHASPLATVRF
ncbi:MAG: stalk domain-containing protein, partial [Armatimonadota bacterium]